MSLSNFQFFFYFFKFHMTPQLGEEQVVSSSKVRTFTSSRTGGADQLAISSQGASVSGKRGLNLDASDVTGARIQISGRDNASGNSRAQLSSSTQGFGFSSTAGEGNAGMMKTTTETRTISRFGRSSHNSREGSNQDGLQISNRGKKIKIESESVLVPTASSDRNKLKIESEKVMVPTATAGGRNRIKIESEKVIEPTATAGGRNRLKIESEKVIVPTDSNEKNKIKIEIEQDTEPTT